MTMTRRWTCGLIVATVSAATWLSAGSVEPGAAADVYTMPQAKEQSLDVVMINGGGRPPHIAVPPFLVMAADRGLQDASRTVTEVLSADLAFEREFDVVPTANYAGIPVAPSVEDLPYERWAALGADFVALGAVKPAAGGKFDVELRVMSVKERRQSYSGAFNGSALGLRRIAHLLSDDMHKVMRGVNGVACTRIAYSSTVDGEHASRTVENRTAKEIYIMDYDGANVQKVTSNRFLNLSPSWCPGGQCLAYMSYAPNDRPDIVWQNIFGVVSASYPAHGSDRIHNYLPRISPDGMKIAYGSSRNGQAMDIYVVNRDGSGETRLTNDPKSDGSPTWSPSGNLLAFTSNRSGSLKIYTMNPDGSSVRVIDNNCSYCDRPTFAPGQTGLLLAYSNQTGRDTHDIDVFDFNTGATRRLTNNVATNESPSFAPNGRHILFMTTRWGKEQLAIVDIDGKNVRQLTRTGANTWPSWSGFLK